MTAQSTMLDSLIAAMAAEQKASEFYRDAATKAQSPRGKNLLEQLADFERGHFLALEELHQSIAGSGEKVTYEGREFEPVPAEATGAEASKETNLNEVFEVLRLAIQAENDAHARYLKMAKATDDPDARALLEKLAAEETMHRRILSDEFYQLNNSGGQWVWME